MSAFYRCALREQPRLERLRRLVFLTMVAEINADPTTSALTVRARRADRVAVAYRAERARQLHTEPCGVCGQPGRIESGLCDTCQDSYDHHMAEDYAFWRVSA